MMKRNTGRRRQREESDEDEYDLNHRTGHFMLGNNFGQNMGRNLVLPRKKKNGNSLENKIEEEIKNRDIQLDDVYKIKMSMEDYIWFYNKIKSRDMMDEYSEERFDLSNEIYNKYNSIKDNNYEEVEKLNNESIVEKDIVKKILESKHDLHTKSILYKKYKLYCTNTGSEEYAKNVELIDTVLSLPVKDNIGIGIPKHEIGQKLDKLHYYLNNKIYGLNSVKEKIMTIMNSKMLNNYNKSSKIVCMVGPPGVGKTAIASTIAEAMELPFDQISFGSIQDSKILSGHSSVYVGALPGMFTKILIKAKRLDSIVLLDEIDKITDNADSNITSVLYHVLDKTQNNRFKDVYIPEIPLDLSQIIFLCAANNVEKIDPILRDRMEFIEIPGYSIDDKVNIAEKFLIPKFKNDLQFKEKDVVIANKELKYLISKKTIDQPGMRNTERKIKELLDKLALLKHYPDSNDLSFHIKNLKFPVKVTSGIIDKLLRADM